MEFNKVLVLLICAREADGMHVSRIGVELARIAGDCSSWRHWLSEFVELGYLESLQRGWYRITVAGARVSRQLKEMFARAGGTLAEPKATENSIGGFEDQSESEDLLGELLEIWSWAPNNQKKKQILSRLVADRKDIKSMEDVRKRCAGIWGAVEEIPERSIKKFEVCVSESADILKLG